jgi:hypothetical protein
MTGRGEGEFSKRHLQWKVIGYDFQGSWPKIAQLRQQPDVLKWLLSQSSDVLNGTFIEQVSSDIISNKYEVTFTVGRGVLVYLTLLFNCICYPSSSTRFVNDELEKMWKKAAVARFRILFQNLHGRTE